MGFVSLNIYTRPIVIKENQPHKTFNNLDTDPKRSLPRKSVLLLTTGVSPHMGIA